MYKHLICISQFAADKDYLMKEKSILQLLVHIQQPLLYPKLAEIAETYKIEDHMDLYLEKESIMTFCKLYKEDLLLKRGEVFTPLEDEHLQQAIYLFDMFYFAKDWDTMYKTAIWARQNVNEGLFAYAFTTALRHRADTRTLMIPPLYEMVPYMFIRSETIQKAYETRMRTADKTDKDIVVIPSNFSERLHPKMNPEMRLAYFTEDLALNEWNMETHMESPWWMMANRRYTDKTSRYGEIMYYKQKQLLARYRLERLSNNLEDLKKFMWTDHKMVGYAPHLRYKNGKEMPMRPDNIELEDTEQLDIETVKAMEVRIQTAIDSGFIVLEGGKVVLLNTENGVEIISRLIDQTMEGVNPKMYGSLLRKLLTLVGRMADPKAAHGLAPGALMHFETQLRDPLFYPILSRIHDLYRMHKTNAGAYKKEDLFFPGVSVETLEVEKLITFFETFDIELNNAMDVSSLEEDKKVTILARQTRINYKPFTFRAMVSSDKQMSAVVRIFFGPKRDSNGLELTLKEKAPLMVEVDRFVVDLNAGKNKIERSSNDFSLFEEDKMSFRILSKKIEDAIQGKAPFYIDEVSV